MHLPQPRGPLSARVVHALRSPVERSGFTGLHWSSDDADDADDADVLGDDVQLALWLLYETHYRGFDGLPDHEWDPEAVRLRREIEAEFEGVLRRLSAPAVEAARAASEDLAEQLEHVTSSADGPDLVAFLHREASHEQFVEYLVQRSLYHLKESDPHSFVLPRIDGNAKTALAELQYDEYGSGRPERLHARLFGDALESLGLDRDYGAYVDHVPAHTLAVNNAMSLFALQRRLRGAALGHLAAFEMTSSIPCRKIAGGAERLGLPSPVAGYFLEHVEADAVHEQVACRDVCGSLVADEPSLRDDVLLGAATCLALDALAAEGVMAGWAADESVVGRAAS